MMKPSRFLRVIRLYGDNGDCVQIIYTDFLNDNDENDHGNNEDESIDDIVPATTGNNVKLSPRMMTMKSK